MTAEVDIHADLSVALGRLTADVAALRAEGKRRWTAADIWRTIQGTTPLSAPGGTFALPQVMDEGPSTGYAWAIQRITIAGLGATTDQVTVYRGASVAEALLQNALFTFTVPVVGAVSTWHPGGKGLLLVNDEALVFGGTLTGTGAIVNVEAVQMTLACLPDYLI